jgi:uncharacterized membrane protein
MSLYAILKLLHILAVIVFVGGLFARQAVRSFAERAPHVRTFASQSEAAGQIENRMVIPGNAIVIVIGVPLALVSHQPILGFLQGATQNWLLVSNVILILLMLLVPLVFLPRGKAYGIVLADALDRDQITPELRVALHDPIVRTAHIAEMLGVVIVTFLMVVKPF